MRALYKPGFQHSLLKYFIILTLALTFFITNNVQGQNPSNNEGTQNFDYKLPLKPCNRQIPSQQGIIVVASDNEKGIIIADSKGLIKSYDIKSGSINWETDLNLGLNSNIEIDDKNIYIATKAEKEGESNTKIRALSKQTGIIIWQNDILGFEKVTLKKLENLLVQTNLETSYINTKNGSILWKNEKKGSNTEFEITLNSVSEERLNDYFQQSEKAFRIVLDKNKINTEKITASKLNRQFLIVGDNAGNIWVFDVNSRRKMWSGKNGGKITSVSLIGEDKILIGSLDNFLYLFDINNGNKIWKKRFNYRLTNKPTIEDKIILVSEINGINVSIIESESGKVLNQINLPENSFITENSIIFADKLIIPTNKGISLYSWLPC